MAGTVATAAALAVPGAVSAGPDPTAPGADGQTATGAYIVQLADDPVATYAGAVPGLRSTRPAPGVRLDRGNADVKKYVGYLDGKRNRALSRVKGARKLYDYSYTFAGFSARMDSKQVAALRRTPGVVSVTRDERRTLDTVTTPDFLGLTGPTGVWQQQFGGPAKAGDGVIVGVIDSGLWPENPSFAPLPASPKDAAVARRFKGVCDRGIERPVFTCNSKVIGARYFVEGLGPDQTGRDEYFSPRDANGHGSHTAGTAAGNYDVPVTVDGANLGRASGMAPAARIAVYKVCWNLESGADSCSTADSVAAIDTAVADGVDVLNYSISGSQESTLDPVEVAFFRAAQAGVFVAASAGNSGPASSTVAHNSPWLTTVAAGTHDRVSTATVTLGNGATYTGGGSGAAVPTSPLVLSTAAAKAGADPDDARLCFLGTLDPAKAAGKIVVCDRGVNARTEKSLEVKNAGGVGMVLVNTAPSSINADLHYVPTVHLDEVAGAAVKAYAATAGATAALSASVTRTGAPAPKVATFSSRGPALAGSGDLLKPDIMAPGVDVLAAVSPPGNNGRNFDLYSGTSMSSPHIAGLAALVIGRHPRWSPMEVKSALMTTATTRDNQGRAITTDTGGPATPVDYGSGQVVPARSFTPGLVYDSGPADWVRYLCGTGELPAAGPDCTAVGGAIDPSNLNMPSIAVGGLAGVQTVTRTVTNRGSKTATYVASVQEPEGVDVTVQPSRFTIAPGARRTFRVTVRRVSADYDAYAFGSLTWTDGRHQVRSPIAVQPVAIAAPVEVTGTGPSGSTRIPVTPGFTGTLTSSLSGLVGAQVSTADLRQEGDPFDPAAPAPGARTAKFTVAVPAGTKHVRFATFDADYPAGTDLDVYVYQAGELVGIAAAGTSQEIVDLPAPPAGSYDVYVDLFSAEPVTAKLNSFVVTPGPVGNATVTPASQPATIGTPTAVTVTWTGLEAGRRWLGQVDFSDGGTGSGSTLVSVQA